MNDATDIETLWNEYYARIYGYIVNQVRDHDLVDDMVSNVFLRATVAIRNGNGSTTNVMAGCLPLRAA